MNLPELSIRRHVFAFMLNAVLILFGVIAYERIGVDKLPYIEFPVISVSTTQRVSPGSACIRSTMAASTSGVRPSRSSKLTSRNSGGRVERTGFIPPARTPSTLVPFYRPKSRLPRAP